MNALYHHLCLSRSLTISNRIIHTKCIDNSLTHLPHLVYGNSSGNTSSDYLPKKDGHRNDCLSFNVINLPRSQFKIRTFITTKGEKFNYYSRNTNGSQYTSSSGLCLISLASSFSQSPGYPLYLWHQLSKLKNRGKDNLATGALYGYKQSNNRDDKNYEHSGCRILSPYRNLIALSLFSIFGRGSEDDEKELTPLDILIRKGAYCLMKQDYTKAEEVLHDALLLAQDDNNYEKEMLVNNLLASSYFESEDLSNAEKMFVEIIKRMINNNTDPTDPAILELSLKLASIYSRTQDTHHKAIKGYKFVIDTLQEKLKDLIPNLDKLKPEDLNEEKKNQLALLGWGYDWLAKHYIGANNMNEATRVLKRAVEISSVILGKLHDQTLILMNDVGTTLAMSDSPEEGCDYIKKAVKGAQEADSQELASFYANLGLVCLQMLKIGEAKFYCEKSLKLASINSKHYNSKDVIATSKNCIEEIQKLLKLNE